MGYQQQNQAPTWKEWAPNSPAPKPDLEAYQLKACFKCKGTRMNIVESTHQSGTRQFKGECIDCHERTGALPYARDAESLGCNVVFFGKHKGKTLAQITEEDPEYLNWCMENLQDVKLLGTIVLYQRTMKEA